MARKNKFTRLPFGGLARHGEHDDSFAGRDEATGSVISVHGNRSPQRASKENFSWQINDTAGELTND